MLNLHIGTSGYAYAPWKGKFYPAKLPNAQMLPYYAERFRAVEINSTFYNLPETETVLAWAAAVPGEFQFACKAPQRITHIKRLKECREEVKAFLNLTKVLKKRRGPVLFQLPPNFKKDIDRLKAFLALVPATAKATFEFRHASWFEEDVFALLSKRTVALCIADAEETPTTPFVATATWGYLRLRREHYTPKQLKAWWDKIRVQDWTDAHVYFKHEDEAHGPKLAAKLIKIASH